MLRILIILLLSLTFSGAKASFSSQEEPHDALRVAKTVEGSVWNDKNCNGSRDAGEPVISGQPLWLVAAGPDGVVETGDDRVVEIAVSSGSGTYFFTLGALPTKYTIRILLEPDGYYPAPLGQNILKSNWTSDGFQIDQNATSIKDVGLCQKDKLYLPFVSR